MKRDPRLFGRVVVSLGAALVALILVLGVTVVPDPAETAPSAITKLYDPEDL